MPIPSLGQPGFGMDMKDRFRGGFVANPWIQNFPTPTSFSTAAQTLTGAQLIAGIIVGFAGATSYTYTFPSAALLRQALVPYADAQGVQIGDCIQTLICAGGTGTAGLQLVGGTGGSFDTNGSPVVPAQSSKYVLFRFTAVIPGSETYVVYT